MESNPIPPIWLPTTSLESLPAPADDADLMALQEALAPLRPFLRSARYEREEGQFDGKPVTQCRATLCIGHEADLLSIVVRPQTVIVDIPVGELPQSADALAAILQINSGRVWKYRVDEVNAAEGGDEVLLVLEAHLEPAVLDDLPGVVMAALMQRGLDQALITRLRGHHE